MSTEKKLDSATGCFMGTALVVLMCVIALVATGIYLALKNWG